MQVVSSDKLDEANVAFGELATEFPTIIDEETQKEILVEATVEAFDRDFEGSVCLASVDINPIAEKAVVEETDSCDVDVEIDDDCLEEEEYEFSNIVDTSPLELIPEDGE